MDSISFAKIENQENLFRGDRVPPEPWEEGKHEV